MVKKESGVGVGVGLSAGEGVGVVAGDGDGIDSDKINNQILLQLLQRPDSSLAFTRQNQVPVLNVGV